MAIGTYTEQAEALHVNGDAAVSGELTVNSLRASNANELTINDNVVITGNLTVSGSSNQPIFCAGKIDASGC